MEQPKIPTLKDAQKPQVKIKGLGAGLTLFDRLKQFKKKDLAFILAGLGTLFMAPLAEHFMMAPENGDASLQKGWGGGSGTGGNFFGTGSSPYENGNNSIAQGGAIGGSGDIITPLNVRDPSALVMGPGGTQQPNAGSIAPPTAPPTAPSSSSEDLKDALAHSASRAASAAVKKAPLPVPKISVGGSGLRGLGVAGGGSSASGGMAPISSGNLGTASAGGGGLNMVRSAPGFRGAAGPRGNGPQGLDGTKRAGQNAGDAFSRTGSALSGLNAAASEQIPTGGSGFNGGGQGGAGANDKNPGGSGPGGSKSVGESLAFIEAKERMMENLKLEFEKRKLKDPELLLYGIRNDIVKASALKIGEGLTKKYMCKWGGMDCPAGEEEYMCMGIPTKGSDIPKCDEGGGKDSKTKTTACYWLLLDGSYSTSKEMNAPGATICRPTGKNGAGKPDPNAKGAASTPSDRLAYGGDLAKSGPVVGAGLDGGCATVTTLATRSTAPAADRSKAMGVEGRKGVDDEFTYYGKLKAQGANLVKARSLLNGEGTATACGNSAPVVGSETAVALQAKALGYLQEQLPLMNGLVTKADDGKADLEKGRANVKVASELVTRAGTQIKEARTALNAGQGPYVPHPDKLTQTGDKTATRQLTDAFQQLNTDHGTIATAQGKLETALLKAQATVGAPEVTDLKPAGGTLSQVQAQNQGFLNLQSTVERKKALFGENTKIEADKAAWPKIVVDGPKEAGAGRLGTTPEKVSVAAETDAKSAKTSIEAVCTLIKCEPAPKPNEDGTPAPPATLDANAEVPAYADVEAKSKVATESVGTMRQAQTDAIHGLGTDLTELGAKK